MRRVFLSYGHDEHAALATRLKHDLDAAGLPTWFDVDRLRPGGDWERYIEEGLEWAAETPGEGRFVLLMTPHAVRRPDGYCLNELARAFERGLPVVPVMVATCSPPLSIARLQWLDMRGVARADDAVYDERLARLRTAIVEDDLDFEAVQSRLLRLLQPLSFQAEMDAHLADFTGRAWVDDDIDAWLRDERAERVFWITGPPGSGKTALSMWLATRRPDVAGIHVCRHGRSRKGDARRAITSLAYQLSTRLPDYRDRLNGLELDSILAEPDAGTLFDELVSQPLTALHPPGGQPLVLLVDGLDEATEDGRNELAAVLGAELDRTPAWLRVLVTSRPAEPAVALPLQAYEPYPLEEGDEHLGDLRTYLTGALALPAAPGAPADLVDRIVARSEGSFLYARWATLELARGRWDLDDPESLPQGLGGVYLRFFERQFPDPEEYARRHRPVLEALTAAYEALPVDELADMLGWSAYDRDEILESFGSLVRVRDSRLHPFHLSALEWVGDRDRAGRYAVLRSEGSRRLADHCWAGARHATGVAPSYALDHAVAHLHEVDRVEDAGSLLLDARYLRARSEGGLQGLLDDVQEMAATTRGTGLGEALDAVGSVLRLAFEVLLRDPEQLASQLQARLVLCELPTVRAVVEQAAELAAGPMLVATTAALRQAGHPLTRSLRGLATGDDDPEVFALSAVAVDDARNVAMGVGEDGMFHLWNLDTGMLERREHLGEGAGCSVLTTGGTRWVLGGWNGSLTVVDPTVATAAPLVLAERPGPGGQVTAVAVTPDGRVVASGHSEDHGQRGALRLWRLDGLELLAEVAVPDGEVTSIAVSPDGGTVAWSVARSDGLQSHGEVRTSAVATPATIESVMPAGGRVDSMCYSPDVSVLAVGRGDGRIELVATSDGDVRRTLDGHPLFVYTTAVTGLAFSADGARLLSSGWDGALRLWDAPSGRELAACRTGSKIFGLHVTTDDRRAITGHKTGGARIWDVERMADLPDLPRHGRAGHVAAFPDAGIAASGGWDADGASVRAWAVSTGEPLQQIRLEGGLLALAAHSTRQELQIVDEGGVSTWRVSGDSVSHGSTLQRVGPRAPLEPTPTWSWEVVAAPGVVAAWQSGYPEGRLLVWREPWDEAETLLRRSVYSPSLAVAGGGSVCAVLDDDGTLSIVDLVSGRAVTVPTGLAGQFRTAALSRSGALAAVGDAHGSVTLTALVAPGEAEPTPLRAASGDWVSTLAFADDEQRLVIGTAGGRLEIWDLASRSLDSLFCGHDSWTSAWAGPGADHVVAGDGIGGVHLLRRA